MGDMVFRFRDSDMVGGQLKHTEIADDCLVLLSYVSKNRDKFQSLRILEEETGIPLGNLYELLNEAEETINSSLHHVACTYGYGFKIFKNWRNKDPTFKKMIIDVEFTGRYDEYY